MSKDFPFPLGEESKKEREGSFEPKYEAHPELCLGEHWFPLFALEKLLGMRFTRAFMVMN